jgi:cytochrome c556
MKNCLISWGIAGVLLVIVAVLGYRFTVGEVAPSEDGRVAVRLSKDERNALLLEMRVWLKSSQAILKGASEKDFDAVIKAAKKSGMEAEGDTPGSLFRKLPLEMKALGFNTREKFDDIAAEAAKNKDSDRIVAKLSTAMNNCIACHETYQFAFAVK